MEFRKTLTYIVSVLLLSGILGMLIQRSEAAPRKHISVIKVSKNNGDLVVPLHISVDSTTWTTVLAANEDRRYAIVMSTASSSSLVGDICLSTTTTSGSKCTATLPAIMIGQVKKQYQDYSEDAIYGRLEDGVTGSLYLKGAYYYDSKD